MNCHSVAVVITRRLYPVVTASCTGVKCTEREAYSIKFHIPCLAGGSDALTSSARGYVLAHGRRPQLNFAETFRA